MAINQLPAEAIIQYNSVSFGPYTKTTSVSIKPEYDTANRTVMFNRYTLGFDTYITGEFQAVVDQTATIMRQALTKNGGTFICKNIGIGDISVNDGIVQDVDNGPKPRVLTFTPAVGGALASRMVWEIEFAIPECSDAVYKFQAMEFTYTVSDTLENGYTTRSYRGKLRVPQNQIVQGTRLPQDSADFYREQIVFPPPQGFKIKYGSFVLSADRSTLDFDYSHVEMGVNIYPPGITEATASQTYNSTTGGLVMWQSTINAAYEIPKNGNPADAVNAFVDLIKQRCRQGEGIAQDKDGKPIKGFPIPLAFTAEEPDIYGPRRFRFSLTYKLTTRLDKILSSSGLWTPVPGQDNNAWNRWWLSVTDSAYSPRGTAKLEFDIGQDVILDLCRPQSQPPASTSTQPADLGSQVINQLESSDVFPTPPPESSWLEYSCSITSMSDSGNSLVRTMPATVLTAKDDPNYDFDISPQTLSTDNALSDISTAFAPGSVTGGYNGDGSASGGVGGTSGGTGSPSGGIIQNFSYDVSGVRGRREMWYVVIEGYAMRAGYAVPQPNLTQINGIPVVPLDDGSGNYYFKQQQLIYGAFPVFGAAWKLKYGVVGNLNTVPVDIPQNILFPGE